MTIDNKLLFILSRDARLDGYTHIVDYLYDEYQIVYHNDQLYFNEEDLKSLFMLTYSGYI